MTSGNLYIVAAPSGGGKTSLVKALVESMDNIQVSVSHTTRAKRPGEIEGVHYFFISKDKFMDMLDNNGFIEHAQVYDNLYGTSVQQIEERLKQGMDIVLDIDWQGSQQIKRMFPEAVSIFVLPPSLDILRERLQARGQDQEQVIAGRMAAAQEEMSHYEEFDYLIINDDFDKASADLQAIVRANRLKTARQSGKNAKLLSFLFSSK